MQVILEAFTPNPDHVIAMSARQCYEEGFVGDKWDDINELSDEKLINRIVNMGHTSVLEHTSFTFAIQGVSRALTHQLVRFRHASFSQQSQRYCTFKDEFEFVTPLSIQNSPRYNDYCGHMNMTHKLYNALLEDGVPAEDARFVLPNAATSNIIVTMNAREIHHACGLRECNHAQWEIRDLFTTVNSLVKAVAPITFAKLGPSCVTKGICSEGSRCCGRINNL